MNGAFCPRCGRPFAAREAACPVDGTLRANVVVTASAEQVHADVPEWAEDNARVPRYTFGVLKAV